MPAVASGLLLALLGPLTGAVPQDPARGDGRVPAAAEQEPESPPDKTLTIVAFGDESTAPRVVDGFSFSVYPDFVRRGLSGQGVRTLVVNSGMPGMQTGTAADHFDRDVRAHRPDLVILQFGRNDAWVDHDAGPGRREPRVPLARFRARLEGFVRTLAADGARTLLLSPPPLGTRHAGWRHSIVHDYIKVMREVAVAEGVTMVDVWSELREHTRTTGTRIDDFLLDGASLNANGHRAVGEMLLEAIDDLRARGRLRATGSRQPTHYDLPVLDLARDLGRQTLVDAPPGQSLGPANTVLLGDGRTLLAVYPKSDRDGAIGDASIVMKRSRDGGETWGPRLDVPGDWHTSGAAPTLHRLIDENGQARLVLFCGGARCRMSSSEDEGVTWSPLRAIGPWGGALCMASVVPLRRPGHHLALFHDLDAGSGGAEDRPGAAATLYKTFSPDGGKTWSRPVAIFSSSEVLLCEPGALRSPDGGTIAVLLREARRQRNSHIVFTRDEGVTFTDPVELPAALTGERHRPVLTPAGRIFVAFRDTAAVSATAGDWVGWVGSFDDLLGSRPGRYRVRLMDAADGADDQTGPGAGHCGVEVLADGTIVATGHGRWRRDEPSSIVSIRLQIAELDRIAAQRGGQRVR